MYIQDDFYEAVAEQPKKVQYEVLGSLACLFFEGESDPDLKGVSKSLHIAFRDRVLLARKKSNKWKDKRGSSEDETRDETEDQTDFQTEDQTDLHPDIIPTSNSNLLNKRESEREKENKKKNKREREFIPPTLDEVKQYVSEKSLDIDPQHFHDYYKSQGWKKNNGQKVVDWKACLRTWSKNETKWNQTGGEPDASGIDLGRWAGGF